MQEAINAAGGPAQIMTPAGTSSIYGPIFVPYGGYRISGQSRKATVLAVQSNFPLTASGVFIFASGPPSNLNFGEVDHLSVVFPMPPDSTNISLYTQWPAAVYNQNAAYVDLTEFETDYAWISVDARSNGPVRIYDSWLSGFNHGAWLGNPGDTNRMHGVHMTCGQNCTANNVLAQKANAIGVQVDNAFLEVEGILTYSWLEGLLVTNGYVYGSGWGFDGSAGMVVSGGVVALSGGYFTPTVTDSAISQSGGTVSVSGASIVSDVTTGSVPVISISNSVGGINRLSLMGLNVTMAADIPFLQESTTTGGAIVTMAGSIVNTSCSSCTHPLLSLPVGSLGLTVYGNQFINTGGTAQTALSLPYAPGTFQISFDSNLVGPWSWSLPSPPGNVTINVPIPSVAGVVTSASTIAAPASLFHISGTAAIGTMTLPANSYAPQVCAIADGAYTTVTGGNFAAAYTAVVNTQKCWSYNPVNSLWY
jgi:hypothetical protein